MSRELDDRKNKADQSDTYKMVGIVSLAGALILIITGAVISGDNKENTKKYTYNSLSFFLKDNKTPCLMMNYNF